MAAVRTSRTATASAVRHLCPTFDIIPRMRRFVLFLLLPMAPGFAARPLSLEDYYRVESAATPPISPDGRWVVFVRSSIIESENQRQPEFWPSPTNGSS